MSSWFRVTPESEALLEEERLVVAATEAICEAMERKGINRRELAEILNVKPSEVSQRLSGRRNLTLRSLAAMLHAAGVRARLSIEDERTPFVAGFAWNGTSTATRTSKFEFSIMNGIREWIESVPVEGTSHATELIGSRASLGPGFSSGNAKRWDGMIITSDGSEILQKIEPAQ